jgi:hypothetical protein
LYGNVTHCTQLQFMKCIAHQSCNSTAVRRRCSEAAEAVETMTVLSGLQGSLPHGILGIPYLLLGATSKCGTVQN